MSFAALREAIRDLKSGQCHPSIDCHCALRRIYKIGGDE